MSVIRVVIILFTLTVAALSFAIFASCACEREASAEGSLEEYQARRAARAEELAAERRALNEEDERWQEEFDQRMRAPIKRVEVEPAEVSSAPKRRRVRRFQWESPAETRGKIWNVPEEESHESLLTALLRVCMAEADGDPQDCAGIWQVVKNNRRRSCDRGMIRRITECVEGEGETHLSALRRHQRHVLGFMKARNRRAVWVGKLTPDCEMPEGYPGTQNHWDSHYGSKVCPQAVADARRLLAGELPESRPGHRVRWLPGRPITWGGRCEAAGGACDDRIACSRGLVRIPSGTLNAFWRRARGPEEVDPICQQLGFTKVHPRPAAPVAAADPPVVASSGG